MKKFSLILSICTLIVSLWSYYNSMEAIQNVAPTRYGHLLVYHSEVFVSKCYINDEEPYIGLSTGAFVCTKENYIGQSPDGMMIYSDSTLKVEWKWSNFHFFVVPVPQSSKQPPQSGGLSHLISRSEFLLL